MWIEKYERWAEGQTPVRSRCGSMTCGSKDGTNQLEEDDLSDGATRTGQHWPLVV